MRQAGCFFEPAGFSKEIKSFMRRTELHRRKVFPMGFVFHFPAVGLAAVCIVSRQAASMFFHLAGRTIALLVRRFFGSAPSSKQRICTRTFGDPLHRELLRENPAEQETGHPGAVKANRVSLGRPSISLGFSSAARSSSSKWISRYKEGSTRLVCGNNGGFLQ